MRPTPVNDLYSMGQPAVTQREPSVLPPAKVDSIRPDIQAQKRSKRQIRVDSIGYPVNDLATAFRTIFPNQYKYTKSGQRVLVSDTTSLKISGGIFAELKDKGLIMVLSADVWNPVKGTQYTPQIALYRTSTKDPWSGNCKGKVICDCAAHQYNLAYPNNATKNFRDIGLQKYAATTYSVSGNRVRSNKQGMCKHLRKLWDKAKSMGFERLAKASYIQ